MKNFLDNWDYKKHAAAVTAFYLGTAIVGNAILGKKLRKTKNPTARLQTAAILQRNRRYSTA